MRKILGISTIFLTIGKKKTTIPIFSFNTKQLEAEKFAKRTSERIRI
jgi:hypothetical protein